MKVEIEKLSVEDLNKKIEAIKSERERTANALKKYEEELERREQEVSLGVPLGEGRISGNIQDSFKKIYTTITLEETFESIKSSELFFDRLKTWRKEYTANSKGEPIDIAVLLPLLKKGKVCYSPELGWAWCSNDGKITCGKEQWFSTGENWLLNAFNLKPAENWETSLMECGL